VNNGRSYEDGVRYKLYLMISSESLKCARLLGRDNSLRKVSNVIISGVNFSRGNKAAGVSIREVVEIDYIIILTLVEVEGPEGAGGVVEGN
jgi:hypothetical protein